MGPIRHGTRRPTPVAGAPGSQTIRSPKASVALGRRFFEDDFYPSGETPEGGRVIGVQQEQDAGNLCDRCPPNPSCMTLPFLVTPLPLAVCPGRSDPVIRGGIQRPYRWMPPLRASASKLRPHRLLRKSRGAGSFHDLGSSASLRRSTRPRRRRSPLWNGRLDFVRLLRTPLARTSYESRGSIPVHPPYPLPVADTVHHRKDSRWKTPCR